MKTIKNIAPSELESVLKNDEYLEDGGMMISSLNFTDKDLNLAFDVFINNTKKEKWELKITEIVSERFIRSWTTYFTAFSDHFLLYEYTDVFTELYYYGKSKNQEKLFLDLYRSHLKNYYDNLPFAYGINESMDIFKLCKDKSGMFARGPKKILTQYQKCLATHGINSNFVGETLRYDPNLKLLVFGESYFIGKDFIFTRKG